MAHRPTRSVGGGLRLAALVLGGMLGLLPHPAAGHDLDGDCDVDRNDLSVVLAARNRPADGPEDPRDLDGDGTITVLDARRLVLRCHRPGCATEAAETGPGVTILEPAHGTIFAAGPIAVSGTVGDPSATVEVNGVPAVVDPNGFSAEGVGLEDGENCVVAVALHPAGSFRSHVIRVRLEEPAAAAPPSLSHLVAPDTLSLGAGGLITFDYADPDGDIAALEIAQGNALGQSSGSVGAEGLGITGTEGQVSLPITTSELPVGTTTFRLRLRDQGGRWSNTLSFALDVVGASSGGMAPVLSDLAASASRWNRPSGALDRLEPPFSFSYADVDGDVARVRKRVRSPGGDETVTEDSASSYGIHGTEGVVQRPLLSFRSTSATGVYTVELTLIDGAGAFSEPRTAHIELVDQGGLSPLTITGFQPQEGAAGTEVTLSGSGFDATSLESNQVEISELRAEVTDVSETSLTIVIPHGAVSDPILVRNANGAAASPASFLVTPTLDVSPEAPSVVVGETVELVAELPSAAAPELVWKVNEVTGGDESVGRITPEGLYTAPPDVPADGTVVVEASLAADPGVRGETVVTILPPPLTPGSALVLASAGGKVTSADGRAAVEIPAGALPVDARVSVEVLRGSAMPPPPSGERVFSAIELLPEGVVFHTPVTVTLPLVRYFTPGSELALRYFDPLTGTYEDPGVVATVGENGEQAVARIAHFSVVTLTGVELAFSSGPPRVDALEPAEGQEGAKVPVRITGENLTPDLETEVLRDGFPTQDVLPGAWYALGEEAGVLLDVQTLRDLPLGARRTYTLRWTDRGGDVTHASFTVIGLDELDVASGQTVVDPPAGPYSEIDVDGIVSVSAGRLALESTGPVSIDGILDARGARGEDGNGKSCGGLGPGEGDGACGRAGARDGRGGRGRDRSGDPEDENFGGDAFRALGRNGGNPRGVGGRPGSNLSVTLGIEEIILAVVECVEVFLGTSDSVQSCVDVVRNIADTAEMTADLIENPAGRRGFGAAQFSDGGGGGGGGSLDTPKIPLSELAFFFPDISLTVTGGGGGSGGRGGQHVRIVSPDPIVVGRAGGVNVRGGDGGDGADEGTLGVRVHVPLIGGLLPDAISGIDGLFAISGGGGGGGSGGSVALDSGTSVLAERSIEAQVDIRGGRGVRGGRTILENENLDIFFERSEASEGARGVLRISSPDHAGNPPVFDPETLESSVTNRALTPVRVKTVGTDPVTIRIEGERGRNREIEARRAGDAHFADIVLFRGFNTVCVAEPSTPCASSFMPALLQKSVLSIFTDLDGDGLSLADELLLGTDPTRADTDGDGLDDAEEVANRTNPLVSDTDGDGVLDGDEVNVHGTDPRSPDTDADGVEDGVEIVLGTDPNSAAETPRQIPAGTLLAHAGGHLAVLDPATGRSGRLGRPNGGLGFGLAFDENATLFTANGSRLSRHEPLLDTSTDVGAFRTSLGDALQVFTLAYDPAHHNLYGVEDDDVGPTGQLVRIDRSTALVTRIGAPAGDPIHSLTFTRDGRLLAALALDGSSDRLVEMDPATGDILTEIGPIVGATPLFGLATLRDGRLVASNRLSNEVSEMLALDPTTGQPAALSTVNRPVFDLTVMPCPAPCLDQPPANFIGTFGSRLALGNLDGDGDLDLVTANGEVFLWDAAAGRFLRGMLLRFGSTVAVSDLNGDGHLDVVIFTTFGGNPPVPINPAVHIYAGTGTGSFVSQGQIEVASGGSLVDLAIADVTGDGRPDILAATSSSPVRVVVRDPVTGGFALAPFSFSTQGAPAALETGDLNLDGETDVLVASSFANGGLTLHLSDGVGGFAAPMTLPAFPSGERPRSVAVADFDGNQTLDVAVSSPDKNTISVLRGDGTGSFLAPMEFPVDDHPAARGGTLVAADVTGDRVPDLVLSHRNPVTGRGGVIVLIGDGAGGFTPAVSSPYRVLEDFSFFVAVGDIDGNGLLDVVAPGEAITVLLNHPSF